MKWSSQTSTSRWTTSRCWILFALCGLSRRLLKQNVFCLADSLSSLHVKLSLDLCLCVFALFVCFINPFSSQPLLFSCSSAYAQFGQLRHLSVDCASRIYLLYSALRESQLIFIYFNVAPPRGAWHRQSCSSSCFPRKILCITCKFIDPVLQQRWNC